MRSATKEGDTDHLSLYTVVMVNGGSSSPVPAMAPAVDRTGVSIEAHAWLCNANPEQQFPSHRKSHEGAPPCRTRGSGSGRTCWACRPRPARTTCGSSRPPRRSEEPWARGSAPRRCLMPPRR